MTKRPTFPLFIGSKLIPDLLNPEPQHIDLDGIERNLWSARRFSNNPDALLVRQHTWLVEELASVDRQSLSIRRWCRHHDDHEGITGDHPGPLKALLRDEWNRNVGTEVTDPVSRLEAGLDIAICGARAIPLPTYADRRTAHTYDKIAEALEWRFALHQPEAPWNAPLPRWICEQIGRDLIERAKLRKPDLPLRQLV